MAPAPVPLNEEDRLAALRDYDVLDTACEKSFDVLARLAAQVCRCPIALISLVDTDRQWFKSHHGCDLRETSRDASFCAHAILDPSRTMIVPDATQDVRFADNALVTGAPHVRFYAGAPIVSPQRLPIGTLCVIDTSPRIIDEGFAAVLEGIAKAVTTTLELRRLTRQMQTLALIDALTELPNRPAFTAALWQAIARQRRHGCTFAVIFCDLDGFKQVNDKYGHAVGDRVLAEAGRAIRSAIRREDLVARIGGDEFGAILLVGDGSEASLAAERLRRAVESAMTQRGWAVTASVGAVAFLVPPASAGEALALADALMYAAKGYGKNRVVSREFPHLLWNAAAD